MKEAFLHYAWKYQKLQLFRLHTTQNEPVVVTHPGIHNDGEGPDFLTAHISVGGQRWVGNVEIHVKSSDWYAHGHHQDEAYNNVILHAVWEDDMVVFRHDGTEIPVLELSRYLENGLLDRYQSLLYEKKTSSFINCEKQILEVDKLVVLNWLERMFFERLEQKSVIIEELLKATKYDWEWVLFMLLMRNFGLNINGDSFFGIGGAVNFSVIRRYYGKPTHIESLLFGLAGLLNHPHCTDTYYLSLKEEFNYLKKKHNLEVSYLEKPKFFRLRPSNFPTIRLSQIANLYATQINLFGQLTAAPKVHDIYAILKTSTSRYWDTHYVFGKKTFPYKKKLSRKFMDLIIINTLVPLRFCFARYQGDSADEEITKIMMEVKHESNAIVDRFRMLGISCSNAMGSQGLLQLYKTHCTQNKCVQCAIGNQLLNVK